MSKATPTARRVRILPDRRIVTIPAEQWEKAEAWVEAPAKDIPALRKLSATRPAWQD